MQKAIFSCFFLERKGKLCDLNKTVSPPEISSMDPVLPIIELSQVEIQEAYQLLARTVDELVAKYGRGQ